MRLLTYQTPEGPAAAIQVDDALVPASAVDAPASTVRGLLEALEGDGLRELAARAEDTDERIALADATLCAPIPDARKIICLGLNYRDHAEETGQEIPAAPMWFAKFANSLTGSGQPIVLPEAHAEYVDYEAELALVVGRTAKHVTTQDALSYLAGAMPFNDVSARDLQLQNPLWTSGKAIDTFAPCGPALVTLDEIDDLAALELRTRINGETLQRGTAANLIFAPADLIAWLSRTITLLPGDIIATGTPAGVGATQGRFCEQAIPSKSRSTASGRSSIPSAANEHARGWHARGDCLPIALGPRRPRVRCPRRGQTRTQPMSDRTPVARHERDDRRRAPSRARDRPARRARQGPWSRRRDARTTTKAGLIGRRERAECVSSTSEERAGEL